ncbi:hypothetical protein AB0D13_23190 [Streptomyces sp. NPDC048430]|uniref:hypothetical protein n=1 Tax=Streptomyces sp. NPDC048430 TaxID=3155388 RepID=UPI0034347693
MIGAVAAISSVVFTGWATYVSAKVAQDQLEQSREDNEKEERRQASRVTFWTEGSSLGSVGLTVHLVNRTPDPVNRGHIHVRTPKKSATDVYDVTGDVPAVPPCSELVFKMADQKAGIPDPASGKPRGMALTGGLPPWKYEFVDNNGVVWVRMERSLERGAEGDLYHGAEGSFYVKHFETRPVKPCDEYSSK